MSARKVDQNSILIVDDDEAVTQTFARMLELEGYAVRTAVNAETGLRAASEYLPDAIILDLRMPLMDGLGFLRRLRGHDSQKSTAVSTELRQLGAEVKFKPMWLEDLVGLARTLLEPRVIH
jgi:DNA-binding response OmpR family regulator